MFFCSMVFFDELVLLFVRQDVPFGGGWLFWGIFDWDGSPLGAGDYFLVRLEGVLIEGNVDTFYYYAVDLTNVYSFLSFTKPLI